MVKIVKLFEYLQHIDRRIIFLLLAIVVIIPLVMTITMSVTITPEVKMAYDEIEKLPSGTLIFMALDYDPATAAEMAPLAEAVIRHVYSRNLKMVSSCLSMTGVSLVEGTLKKISNELGKKYGEDYVYLGYKPYPAIVIMQMGEDFRAPFPKDYYKQDLEEIPMMKGIKNFDNMGLVCVITSTSGIDMWLVYGQGKYKFPMVSGLSAVMSTDYYPFLQSGQLKGLIAGLKGASEYEKLINKPALATKGMVVQSFAHILIVFLIFVCNLCYFITRGKEKRV
ncbi:hypothetical protein KKB18_11540 [bacterium]|nr:hypothetical protein [bacterium]